MKKLNGELHICVSKIGEVFVSWQPTKKRAQKECKETAGWKPWKILRPGCTAVWSWRK